MVRGISCVPRLRRLFRNAAFRFALLHTLVFVLSVAAVGLIAEVLVTRALKQQALQRIEQEAGELRDEFNEFGRDSFLQLIDKQVAKGDNRLQFAVIAADGRKVAGEHLLLRVWPKTIALPPGQGSEVALSSSDIIMIVRQPLADGLTLLVANDVRSIEDVEDVVSSAFYIVLGMSTLLGLVGGIFLSGALLRRVHRVTQTAEAIIGGDLSRRIERTGSGDEFDHLSATLNTMLDRINGLMASLHQVSNDIAHDLRTPLSRQRQNLEEARSHATTTAEYAAAVDKAIQEADGLLATFSALLRIAQIDAGTRRAAFSRVDLSEVLQNVGDAYGPAIEDGGRFLQIALAPHHRVEGDRELLTQLFSNLIENAIGHTPKGSAIRMDLERDPPTGRSLARISDNGPGIPPAERPKVFRRFYRLEKSRTTPGNGLGLSAVAAITELHRASIVLSDNRPGLVVTITFPQGV